jgi:hypothetical protein
LLRFKTPLSKVIVDLIMFKTPLSKVKFHHLLRFQKISAQQVYPDLICSGSKISAQQNPDLICPGSKYPLSKVKVDLLRLKKSSSAGKSRFNC